MECAPSPEKNFRTDRNRRSKKADFLEETCKFVRLLLTSAATSTECASAPNESADRLQTGHFEFRNQSRYHSVTVTIMVTMVVVVVVIVVVVVYRLDDAKKPMAFIVWTGSEVEVGRSS